MEILSYSRKYMCAAAVISVFVVGVVVQSPCKAFGDSNEEGELRWTFDEAKIGITPAGFQNAATKGKGAPAVWMVVADSTAPSSPNVVALTKPSTSGSTFNLLLAENTNYKDLEVELELKAVSGRIDQGGGPIWRAKDFNNYYIARWNPLEDNLRLYYVKDGKRVQLKSVEIKTDEKAWHSLEVKHIGDNIEIEFDDKKVLTHKDDTFSEGGMVGLWTKADAATYFDNIEVEKEYDNEDDHDND